jgi:hypothetical protein
VKPGHHKVTTSIALKDSASPLVSSEGGFTWNVKSSVEFDHPMGLEIQLLIVPKLNLGEKDPKKKFSLSHTHQLKAIAEPHAQPVLAKVPDDAVASAAAEKKTGGRDRASKQRRRNAETGDANTGSSKEKRGDFSPTMAAESSLKLSNDSALPAGESAAEKTKGGANQEKAGKDPETARGDEAPADDSKGAAPTTEAAAEAGAIDSALAEAPEDAGAIAAAAPPVVPKQMPPAPIESPQTPWWPWIAAGLVGAVVIFLWARRKG